MSNHPNCLFDVYSREGRVAERLTGREVTRQYGRRIWDLYTEAVDHSPWCDRDECVQARKDAMKAWGVVFSDPFMVDSDMSEPPF